MKRQLFYLSITISFLIYSCKNLPVIEPGESGFKTDISPFMEQKHQLTHSIKADLPNGDRLLLIGVTVVDPVERSIHAFLLTVEGLVLFDISYKNNSIIINRGMPSFDSSDFVQALLDDLKLIYFTPDCGISENGFTGGKFIKRYKCKDRTVVDVSKEENGTMKINKYDGSNDLVRSVNIFSINNIGLPDRLELSAPGLFGYSLYLELINVEKI